MARIGRSPTASTQPRSGQTPSQATLTKLAGATYQAGNLSIVSGSDFEIRYQEQVKDIKEGLAKGDVRGLHDSNPIIIPLQDFMITPSNDPEILAELYKIPAVTIAIAGLASERPHNSRWADSLIKRIKKERDAHKDVIASHLNQIIMEKNASHFKELERHKKVRATPTPTTPAVTLTTERSWSQFAILGIAVVGFIIILRRRA